jgi:hypothetical protein
MAGLPPIGGAPVSSLPVKPISDSRAAAQKAFFDAALGRAGAVRTPPAPAAAQAPARAQAAQAAQPVAQASQPASLQPASLQASSEDAPQRIPRPGSLINIVV